MHASTVASSATAAVVHSGLAGSLARLWSARGKLTKIPSALNAQWHLRHATSAGTQNTLVGRPKITNQGKMTFGDHVQLVSNVATLELVSLPGGHLEIGSRVLINYGSSIVASNHVKIGDHVLIGTHVMVMDCDFHRVEDKEWDTNGEPIILEDRAWLGNRSIILKGVTIGHDSVVAAGSVVTKDVPPRTVVAGNPARVVRQF